MPVPLWGRRFRLPTDHTRALLRSVLDVASPMRRTPGTEHPASAQRILRVVSWPRALLIGGAVAAAGVALLAVASVVFCDATIHVPRNVREPELPAATTPGAPAATTTPILLIHGLKDSQTPPWHSQQLARSNPKAALWLVPGSGHVAASTADPAGFRR